MRLQAMRGNRRRNVRMVIGGRMQTDGGYGWDHLNFEITEASAAKLARRLAMLTKKQVLK